MANNIKGEVALQHEGKTYTMVLDFNALAEFEDATGRNAAEVLASPETMGISLARSLFWAGLQRHHPGLTLTEAGDIMQGNMDKLPAAVQAGTPEPAAGNGKAAPKPRARRG